MRAMSVSEYARLLDHIDKCHSVVEIPRNPEHKRVKYLSSVFDTRTHTIYSVRMRGFGWDETISNSGEGKALFEKCMDFLDGKV